MGFGGRQGDHVTTTGGPEHSLAEPVTSDAIGYPIVVDQGYPELEGDDIVVEPASTPSPHRRTRTAVVAAVVLALIVGGAALAVGLANRNDGGASNLRSVSAAKPPPAHPTPNKIDPSPGQIVKPTPAKVEVPTPVKVVPQPVSPNVPVASPTNATPPPAPPVLTPPVEPTSVLQWKATPSAITIRAGGHKTFVFTVTNPTDGTVALPQPLSCAPVLRGPKGVAFGFGVCVEMTQVMSPHQQLSHTYTIYATDSAGAGGQPLKPGTYTATIDNLFRVNVHITAK